MNYYFVFRYAFIVFRYAKKNVIFDMTKKNSKYLSKNNKKRTNHNK